MGRHVITLDDAGLRDDCSRLEAKVRVAGFDPDVVLAIANGGVYVADCMFDGVLHASTRLQRPGTRAKNGFIGKIVTCLPRFITDFMRIAESRLLSMLPRRKVAASEVVLPELGNCKNILVVDDAIDSGVTMAAVLEAIAATYGAVCVCSAVLTVTTRRPVVRPDFVLYDDLTLIRFTWSSDS